MRSKSKCNFDSINFLENGMTRHAAICSLDMNSIPAILAVLNSDVNKAIIEKTLDIIGKVSLINSTSSNISDIYDEVSIIKWKYIFIIYLLEIPEWSSNKIIVSCSKKNPSIHFEWPTC